MFAPLLVLLFVLVPIAELAILIQVGQALGLWVTIGVLVADSVIGALLMRSQGRASWRRFNEALQSGRVPANEVIDGALVIFGGACLLTPGFMTDIFGLLFLLPPTRAVIRRVLLRHFGKRMLASTMRRAAVPGFGPQPRPGSDVDGTARDVPDPRLQK